MDAPLSLYLARFMATDDDLTAARRPDRASPMPTEPPSPVEPLMTLTVAELEARLAAARRSALAEAASAHEAALAEAALARAADTAAAVAAARGEWAAGEGKAAAAGLEALATLRELLAAKVADVLRPLLARALAERARLALGVALDQILDDPDQPCLTVSGPADLLDAIRAARPATEREGRAIAYVVSEVPDVTVSARTTRIETRLGAALAELAAPAIVDTEPQP